MDKMNEIHKLVEEAVKREFGNDAKLEEGDTLVFQLNDCLLIISLNNGHCQCEFIGGRPIPIDATTGIYTDVEEPTEPWKAAMMNHFTRTE